MKNELLIDEYNQTPLFDHIISTDTTAIDPMLLYEDPVAVSNSEFHCFVI